MPQQLENIITRDAEPSDSQAIRQLALDVRIDAWSAKEYSDEISRPNSIVLKASYHGELIGFLVARIVPGPTDKPDAELYNIAVSPSCKRQGIGTKLLATLIERLESFGVRSLWLEVRESNSEAIGFYRSHGFCSELTRPKFYSNPTENAVIMRLQIAAGDGDYGSVNNA